MSNMKCSIKCPICGEILQKYGEVDPDTGTSIVLGANCRKCGIGNSDIKLWQELIRTRRALGIAVDALTYANKCIKGGCVNWKTEVDKALEQITAQEQKDN